MTQRAPTASAVALLLLSLGLPWSSDTRGYIPGWYTPSFCTPSFDGLMSCSPSYLAPGFTTGSAAMSGADSPARVFVVVALALVGVALWRGRPRLLLVAAGLVVAGVLLSGLAAFGGVLAAVTAAALLCWAGRATMSRGEQPAY